MNQLPIELFRRIFFYIDQLPDLIRASFVCHHWRSHILNDEDFLNKWFHRLLKRSQQLPSNNLTTNDYDHRQELIENFDRFQFPQNLQSSQYHFIRVIDPFYIDSNQYFFEQQYPLSLFKGYHSFSFWFFLPRQCEFVIRNEMGYVLDLHNCRHTDCQWAFNTDKKILFDDQWIHIVITNSQSQNDYRIWINGQDMKSFNLHRTYNKHITRTNSNNAITFTCKLNDYSIQSPIETCIVDLVAFKRCLSITEIRAIYQQQTSIDQVQIGTYIGNTKTNSIINRILNFLFLSV